MRLHRRFAEAMVLLALVGCAGAKPRPANLAPVKIGKPYQVLGKYYYPSDDRSYDARGIASWYGPGFQALSTANGERYDQDDITAAHKTLPMPSYVEVENLDNGRKLTVRINDRGPFVDGRIIDLSRRSAQLLGVDRAGTARVRVRRVFPDGDAIERWAAPARSTPVPSMPILSTPILSKTVVASAPAAVVAGRPTYVQVAALADPGRIAWLRGYLTGFGPVVSEPAPSGLTRLRLGPYADTAAANAALAQLRAAGYSEARLVQTAPNPQTP
jgi:rare lipoprotein A